ncbi:YD repeat-containing protein, partial [Duganella sp. CF458]
NGRGRLAVQADRSGNQLSYSYNGDLLSEVANQDGEKTVLDYANGKLASVHSVDKAGLPHTRVRYAYDGQGRLASVTVDLTPDDNSIADGKVYVTNYTYDGASQRIASIAQTDGTLLRFDYVEFNGTWRVARLRQMIDGVERVTSYDYSDLMNAVPATADVDGGKLSTVGDVTSNNSVPLDNGKVTSSEPRVNNVSAGVDPGKLVTGETKLVDENGNLNGSWLSTTESQAGPQTAIIDSSHTSDTELKDIDHTLALDGGKLSTIEAPVKDQTANLDSSKLSTKDPVTAPGDVPAYYQVQQLDTWQSVTQFLYGTSEADAIETLRNALGYPVLLPGAKLTMLPATLVYGLSTTVAPYFLIRGGDSWNSIASTLYGSSASELANALRDALGNPPLTAGTKLAGLPATITYTTHTVSVPTYYRIKEGDTWESIAQALYRNSDPAVVAALKNVLNNPPLVAGEKLVGMPYSLDYTSDRVPPYYRIKEGDTWASLAKKLYDTSAAASALQAFVAPQELVVGGKLTGLPSYLHYQVTQVVPDYYVIQSGDSWDNLTLKLYGTSDPNAVQELKTRTGGPYLTPGQRLTPPASLTYQTTTQVAVPPYYTVKAGDTWQAIALALYGTDHPAAQAALEAALGKPALAAGTKLRNL